MHGQVSDNTCVGANARSLEFSLFLRLRFIEAWIHNLCITNLASLSVGNSEFCRKYKWHQHLWDPTFYNVKSGSDNIFFISKHFS